MTSQSPLDRPDVLSVLFHPRKAPVEPEARTREKNVSLVVDEGVALAGRLHVSDREAPLILLFHGNGEIAADYDTIAGIYNQMGFSFLVVDYRGYGLSDGRPTGSSLLRDAVAVHRRLPDLLAHRELSPSGLFVMGRSLGSAAAIEVAAQAEDQIAGLLIDSGFAHTFPLIRRLGGPLIEADDAPDGFGNLAKIAEVLVPTLIIHGEADQIIPVHDAGALYARSPAARKQLLTVPNAGHNNLLSTNPRGYFGAISDFAREATGA